jgi:hypothetical protein
MERKIGDRFEWWGKTLEVVEAVENFPAFNICDNCCFNTEVCDGLKKIRGECIAENRADNKDVYFKEIKDDKMTPDDYLKAHHNSGIEVGDTVRVLRKADRNEQGWCARWVGMMDFCIGKEFNVLNDEGITGFKLSTSTSAGGGFKFPWFVLEIIKKKNQCPIDLDDLNFGCIDKEKVEEILNIYLKEKNFYKARKKAVEGLGRYGWAGSAVLNLMDELDFANITTDEFIIVKKLLGRIFKEIKNGNK